MDSYKDRKHCPEIEEIMSGGGPFITRHGVTVTVLAIVIAGTLVMVINGDAKELFSDMLNHVLANIRERLV